MVAIGSRVTRSKSHNIGRGFWLSVVMVVLIGISILLFTISFSPTYPVNVLLISDPMIVLSWDTRNNKVTLLTIPANITIDAVYGYGQYSLESLWRLGDIEGTKGSALLSKSLEEVLAVPLPWYIGERGDKLTRAEDPVSFVKRMFSPLNTLRILSNQNISNIPLSVYIALIRSLPFLSTERYTIVDVSQSDALDSETLADGTHMTTIDLTKLDKDIGTLFEDEQIRKEALRVAVYNTTSTPLLAQRVSRLLTHIGTWVVTSNNESRELQTCEVVGSASLRNSRTARVLLDHYHCLWREGESIDDQQADLTFRIGTEFVDRFVKPPQ